MWIPNTHIYSNVSSQPSESSMNAFAFSFTFYTMKSSIPHEFLGDITVVQFCNLKKFF